MASASIVIRHSASLTLLIAIGATAAALSAPADQGRPASDGLRVVIDGPSADVAIRSFLTGSFGGQGGDVSTTPGSREYVVPIVSEDGIRGELVKVVIFSRGYGIELIERRIGATEPPPVVVQLKPLPSLAMHGRVADLPSGRAHRLVVDYSADWSHGFFGIIDGMVLTFEVASIDLGTDGNFSVMVPDLSSDPTIRNLPDRGRFTFHVRDSQTGRPLTLAASSGPFAGVTLAPNYPKMIDLHIQPRTERPANLPSSGVVDLPVSSPTRE